MEKIAQGLSLLSAGVALGWAGCFSFLIAPQAFRDLDHGRADRFVRNALKGANPVAIGLSLLAAASALLAGAVGAAAVLAMAAAMFFLARWTLAPREEGSAPGVRRRLKTQRIVAAAINATTLLALAAGAAMAALRI